MSNKTFVVQIKGQNNNTWQGSIEWVEENKTIPFRSMMELINLMDSAVDKPAETVEK